MPHSALTPTTAQPLVVVGAGPIGLAAAAHAHERGLPVVVLEAGASAAAAVTEWAHVRLFSPWSELVDDAAARLLEPTGWTRPTDATPPTGAEWVEHYLRPLAEALVAAGVEVRTGHRVTGVARQGRDLLVAVDRERVPFAVHVETPRGHEVRSAAAVVDASGTWGRPGPLGTDGYPAPGEREHADHVTYAVPDVDAPAVRARLAGRHVVVAGAGASAQNALVALGRLAAEEPGTRVTWLLRRGDVGHAFGGGDADELEARGALGEHARAVAESGTVETVTGFRTTSVHRDQETGRLVLTSLDGREVTGVDEVVAVTGFRPDVSWLSEVHLDLDPELSAPRLLAPEIHPEHHSCGSVSPHGASVLRQPEQGLYIVGMKSYGRAPSFLTLTGCEQVRSVVAEIAGDQEAADRVELVLPETGVCGAAPTYDTQGDTEGDTQAGGGCCSPAGPELVGVPAVR
jgi:thioredoxin reductase